MEFLAAGEDDEVLLTPKARYVLRVNSGDHHSGPAAAAQRCRLDFTVPGRLNNLCWQTDAAHTLAAGQVEARVMAVGLNFRDVMLTMGLLTDDAVENGFAGPYLGLEFAGVITRVGKNVDDLRIGDRVTGFASNCFCKPCDHSCTCRDSCPRGLVIRNGCYHSDGLLYRLVRAQASGAAPAR